jgi:hypothetical protein
LAALKEAQFSFSGVPNYKFTIYDSFGQKDAWVVISQVMFRL